MKTKLLSIISKPKTRTILVIFFLFLLVQSSFAANWFVDDGTNNGNIYNLTNSPFVPGNDLMGDGSAIKPYATLLKAYKSAAAGDIIYVDSGLYTDVKSLTFNITKSIQIIGAGFTDTVCKLTSGVDRWSNINSSNVILKKFQILNYNNAADGISLLISGGTGIVLDQVAIYGSTGSAGQGVIHITGNTTSVIIKSATMPCNRIGAASYGGGLKITGSTVLIQNSSYSNNKLTAITGGAILIEGTTANVTIDKCLFEDNEAASAGAIYMTNGTLNVTKSCFNNNKSVSGTDNLGGGAVFINPTTTATTTTANFTDCSFLNNTAQGASQDGGAVLLRNASGGIFCDVVFNTCSFTTNTATDKGEDVYFDQGTAPTAYNVTFKNTTFNTIGAGTKVNLYNTDFSAAWIKFEGLTAPNSTGGNGDIVADGSGVAITKPEMFGLYTKSTTNLQLGLPLTTCVNRYDGICGTTTETLVCETKNTWGDISTTATNTDVITFDKGINSPKTITAATNVSNIVYSSAAHGYIVGDWITVEDCLPISYNGFYKITAVATLNTFSVVKGSAPGAFVSGGTATEGKPIGWSRNTLPTVNEHIIINFDYNTTTFGNIDACKMTVNTGVTLITDNDNKGVLGVDALGTYVYVVNSIVNKGTINVKSNGNLIQVNHPLDLNGEAIVTPDITFTKDTGNKIKWDYVYWSKPVVDNVLLNSTAFDVKYYWNPDFCVAGVNFSYLGWRSLSAEPTIGSGFITRVKTAAGTTPTPISLNMTGLSNNGDITAIVKYYDGNDQAFRNFTFLGNPYPGAIKFEDFYNDNINNIYGTVYLWTSNTPYPGSGLYSQPDYASFNLTGGVLGATTQSPTATVPNGYLASGQGFMVRPKVNGTITFKNKQRTKDIPSNNHFFKDTQSNEKNRFWLRITDSNEKFNEQLIGYIPGATDQFDEAYDGPINSLSVIKFYSILDNNNLNIQGKKEFKKNDIVSIGYSKSIDLDDILTISLSNAEGIFRNNQKIYIHDKVDNKYYDLTSAQYKFTNNENTNNRFEIVYHIKTTNNEDIETIVSDLVSVSIKSNLFSILATSPISKVTLYDMAGKVLFDKSCSNNTNSVNANINLSNGVYISKVILSNIVMFTKKIINQ